MAQMSMGQMIGAAAGAGASEIAKTPIDPLTKARAKLPQYDALPDDQFAERLYTEFYAQKLPRDKFYEMIGRSQSDPAALEKPTNRPSPLGPAADFLHGITDSARQGMTLGFADEVGAAGSATGGALRQLIEGRPVEWGPNYEDALGRQRASEAEFTQKHPAASTAAMLTGGLALPMPNLGAGTAAGTIGRMAGTGAAVGGAAGFGSAEGGVANRLTGAGTGAALGGVLGAALPGLAVAGSKVAQSVKNIAGLQDPKKKALDYLLKKMAQDKVSPAAALRALTSTKPVAIVDLGENLQRAGRVVETIPGRGSARAKQFLDERQIEQGARVLGDVKQGIANVDFMATKESLQAARAAQAAPLYDKAFAAGPVYSDRIAGFLKDPIIKKGISQGLEIQRLESLAAGKPFNPSDYAITGFDAAGAPILGPVPNMRLLDAAKKGLDDILEAARDPTTQRIQWTERLRAIDKVRRSLVSELDGLNVDYKAARQAWAGPSESLDAMSLGRQFARGDSEVVEKTYKGLSATDREFFKMGVVRELEGIIMKSDDGINVVRKIFASKDKRARLATLFDDPADFARFQAAMTSERNMFKSGQVVTGNSVTGRIAAEQDEGAGIERVLMDVATGGTRGAALGAVGRSVNRARGLNEATADELSKMLFAADPKGRMAALQELLLRQARNKATGKAVANTSGRVLGTGANVGGQLLAPAR